jgi:hypothetical protein
MDMQPAPTFDLTTSSVPGIIPEPARFHDDKPTTGATTKPAASPTRRNAASVALTRLLSSIRSDKYLASEYPPVSHRAGTAREVNEGIGQDHHEVTARQSAAVPEQSVAEPAAPNAPAAPTTIAVLRTGV